MFATNKRRQNLKRTRRVEVIRYRRRSAHIMDEAALGSEITDEQSAIESLLKIHSPIESSSEKTITPEQEPCRGDDPCVVQGRTPLSLLRRLMRMTHSVR